MDSKTKQKTAIAITGIAAVIGIMAYTLAGGAYPHWSALTWWLLRACGILFLATGIGIGFASRRKAGRG